MKHTLAVLCVLALAACGKASETAAEKVIESQISKDGTQAKVNLSEGGMKVTTTDASGKTTQMEMGSAKISEAERQNLSDLTRQLPLHPEKATDLGKAVADLAERYGSETKSDGQAVLVEDTFTADGTIKNVGVEAEAVATYLKPVPDSP